jgi:hypothetical protein
MREMGSYLLFWYPLIIAKCEDIGSVLSEWREYVTRVTEDHSSISECTRDICQTDIFAIMRWTSLDLGYSCISCDDDDETISEFLCLRDIVDMPRVEYIKRPKAHDFFSLDSRISRDTISATFCICM